MVTFEEKLEFLHGGCVEFACALHDRYSYPVEHIQKPDGSLTHAYCVAQKNGHLYFIDIRGITDRWDLFVRPYLPELFGAYRGWNINPYDHESVMKGYDTEPHSLFWNDKDRYKKAELIICGNQNKYQLV